MKKSVILLLAAVMALALAACGKDSSDEPEKKATVTLSPTATPTTAPAEGTPAATATPTTAPAKVRAVRHIIKDTEGNTGSVALNTLVFAPKGSVLYVIVKKDGETTEDQTGKSIGGFAFDNSTKEFEYEFVLDHNPLEGEEIRFEFTLADLQKLAAGMPDAENANKAIVTIKDEAYTFIGLDLEFEEN